jgi:hypothetical protein
MELRRDVERAGNARRLEQESLDVQMAADRRDDVMKPELRLRGLS